MAVTSEAPCDVAGVGTILSAPVPIGREGLSALGAGKGVDSIGASFDSLRMSVPPALAAFGRTELDLLPTGYLDDGLSAVLADTDLRLVLCGLRGFLTGEAVSMTEGNDLIFRQTEGVCYIGITESGSAELGDYCFLVTGHDAFTSSFHWRFGADLSGGFFTETKKSLRAFGRTLAGIADEILFHADFPAGDDEIDVLDKCRIEFLDRGNTGTILSGNGRERIARLHRVPNR